MRSPRWERDAASLAAGPRMMPRRLRGLSPFVVRRLLLSVACPPPLAVRSPLAEVGGPTPWSGPVSGGGEMCRGGMIRERGPRPVQLPAQEARAASHRKRIPKGLSSLSRPALSSFKLSSHMLVRTFFFSFFFFSFSCRYYFVISIWRRIRFGYSSVLCALGFIFPLRCSYFVIVCSCAELLNSQTSCPSSPCAFFLVALFFGDPIVRKKKTIFPVDPSHPIATHCEIYLRRVNVLRLRARTAGPRH